jgi:hypothetical protein
VVTKTVSDLRAYITKRVMDRDDAEFDGSYDDWAEIEFDFTPELSRFIGIMARYEGVTWDDFVAALVERRAVQILREHYRGIL